MLLTWKFWERSPDCGTGLIGVITSYAINETARCTLLLYETRPCSFCMKRPQKTKIRPVLLLQPKLKGKNCSTVGIAGISWKQCRAIVEKLVKNCITSCALKQSYALMPFTLVTSIYIYIRKKNFRISWKQEHESPAFVPVLDCLAWKHQPYRHQQPQSALSPPPPEQDTAAVRAHW